MGEHDEKEKEKSVVPEKEATEEEVKELTSQRILVAESFIPTPKPKVTEDDSTES